MTAWNFIRKKNFILRLYHIYIVIYAYMYFSLQYQRLIDAVPSLAAWTWTWRKAATT